MPEVFAPEWIQSQGETINGIDLLGLRLPVQLISGSLLNGITTASPRIRFLSIRSWIIKAFSESGLPNDKATFNEFAGRVEAALAIGVLLFDRSPLYIPGNEKGLGLIDDGIDPIPVEKLLDQNAVYAYTGPSSGLFISFNTDNGVAGLTQERGEPLAVEFEKLISGTRFYEILKVDPNFKFLQRDVLAELGEAINVEEIPDPERDLLIDALMPLSLREKSMQPLRQEVNRLGVYTLLLDIAKLLNKKPEESDFFDSALQKKSTFNETLIPTLDGYLCYRIRDLLSVLHEAAMGIVCSELEIYEGSVSSNVIISALLGDHINKALMKFSLVSDQEPFAAMRYRDLCSRVEAKIGEKNLVRGVYRWKSDLDESAVINTVLKNQMASIGLLPVAWILCCLRVGEYDLKSFPDLEVLSRQGAARIGLKQVVLKQHDLWMEEDPTLDQVIAWQIQRTVDQHLRIAWSRLFNDVNKDGALLTSDGGLWVQRGKRFSGSRTSSRLGFAINWASQLKLIDKDGLTEFGESILQRSHETLAVYGGRA